jgi:hypothetical protein
MSVMNWRRLICCFGSEKKLLQSAKLAQESPSDACYLGILSNDRFGVIHDWVGVSKSGHVRRGIETGSKFQASAARLDGNCQLVHAESSTSGKSKKLSRPHAKNISLKASGKSAL